MKLESFESWLIGKGGEKHHPYPDENNDTFKNNLNDIIEYGTKLLELLNTEPDEWMKDKITVARTYLSDVTHAYMNDIKNKGCGSPNSVDLGYLDSTNQESL